MAIRPLEIRPVVGPQRRLADPYVRPGREGRIPPLVILDDPSRRQPREYIGGRSEGRRKEIKNVLKYKGRRCSPERAEKIAIRAIEWLAQIGLALLLAASLGTIAAAPSSDRPEDSPRRAHPIILDDATDHPLQGHPGPESPFLPLNRASHPRNGQNEAKDGEVAQVVMARPTRVVHRTDRSRGPPGAGFAPPSAARPGSVAPDRRAVAAPRAPAGDGPSCQGGWRECHRRRISTRSRRDSCNFRLRARVEPGVGSLTIRSMDEPSPGARGVVA